MKACCKRSLVCRSSSYTKPGGPKSDPRPISDKAYQANCVRVLIAYLSAHGYDQPLAPKLLASPMSKDVTNIVQFLMRQVRQALGRLLARGPLCQKPAPPDQQKRAAGNCHKC